MEIEQGQHVILLAFVLALSTRNLLISGSSLGFGGPDVLIFQLEQSVLGDECSDVEFRDSAKSLRLHLSGRGCCNHSTLHKTMSAVSRGQILCSHFFMGTISGCEDLLTSVCDHVQHVRLLGLDCDTTDLPIGHID